MIRPDKIAELEQMRIQRCHRGFLLMADSPEMRSLLQPMFAFDKIEDLAAFIVEHFNSQVSA